MNLELPVHLGLALQFGDGLGVLDGHVFQAHISRHRPREHEDRRDQVAERYVLVEFEAFGLATHWISFQKEKAALAAAGGSDVVGSLDHRQEAPSIKGIVVSIDVICRNSPSIHVRVYELVDG